jgi:hypothetical protein
MYITEIDTLQKYVTGIQRVVSKMKHAIECLELAQRTQATPRALKSSQQSGSSICSLLPLVLHMWMWWPWGKTLDSDIIYQVQSLTQTVWDSLRIYLCTDYQPWSLSKVRFLEMWKTVCPKSICTTLVRYACHHPITGNIAICIMHTLSSEMDFFISPSK